MLKYRYRKHLILNCPNSNGRAVRILQHMHFFNSYSLDTTAEYKNMLPVCVVFYILQWYPNF